MDGGAWATVHGVAKSQTRLSDFTSLLFVMVTHWKVLCRGNESVDLHVRSVLKFSPQSGDGGGGNIEAEFRDWSQVP